MSTCLTLKPQAPPESDIPNAKNIHPAKTVMSSQNYPSKDDPSNTTPTNYSKTEIVEDEAASKNTSSTENDSTATNKKETDGKLDPAAGADPRRKKTSLWTWKKLRDRFCPPKGKESKSGSSATGLDEKKSEKELLQNSIEADISYVSTRAKDLEAFNKQLNSVLGEARSGFDYLKQHGEVESFRELKRNMKKLKVQDPSKYRLDADEADPQRKLRFSFKAEESIPQGVLDMMPQLHNSDVFEASVEFKDFEARYNKLDNLLKLCLLCFSIFPPNTIIKKRLMVQWWVAEGFAFDHKPEHNHERVADGYFNQLIDEGLIEAVNKNRSRSVGSCRMHPFNLSALVMLAKRAKFFNFDDGGEPTQNFSGTFQACLVGEGLISYEDLKGGKLRVADLEKLHLLKGKFAFDDLKEEMKENNLTVDDLEKVLLEKKRKENKLTDENVLENILKENKLTLDDLERKMKEYKFSVDLENKVKENKLTVDDLEKKLKENQLTVDDHLEKKQKENKLSVECLEKLHPLKECLEKLHPLKGDKPTGDDLKKKLEGDYKLSVEHLEKLHPLKGDKSTVDDLKKKLKGDYKLTVDDLDKLHLLINVHEQILEFKSDWFSKMKNLNFLHLGRWRASATDHIEVEDTKFLDGFENMSCLKFLSLQGISNIIALPKSVLKLTNLNIFDLRACYNLETIPAKIEFLKNLTHLDMSECYLLDHIPKSISLLKKLRVLKGFVVGIDDEGKKRHVCTIDDLKNLENLMKLCIYTGSKEFPKEQHVRALGNLGNLLKLTITWGGTALREDKTDEQSENGNKADDSNGSGSTGRLPKMLEKLDLKCFPMSTTPYWLSLHNLKDLEHLKKLYIRGGKFTDLGQYQNVDDFNLVGPVKKETWKVQELRLKYLSDIEMDWRQLQELFPDLVYLEQVSCPKLTLFPCDANGVSRI